MKRNDFLQNLLLIILSAVLAACIVNLACLGALPVTYTSKAKIQLTGEDLHVSDVRDFAGYVENDESLRNKVMEVCSEAGISGSAGMIYHIEATAVPETGIVDIYVRSGDPYVSHAIAKEFVAAAYSDYPAAHAGLYVKQIEAPSVANESDPRHAVRYTILGAVFGAALGAVLSYLAVKGEREKRRRGRTQDPRFARIEEPDEQAYDALFAEDNEDVDPEMRELYKVTKRAGTNRKQEALPEETDPEQQDAEEVDVQEGHMSEEAEAAYLEAMEIEAMAAVEENGTDPGPTSDTEQKGGDHYEE